MDEEAGEVVYPDASKPRDKVEDGGWVHQKLKIPNVIVTPQDRSL